MAFNYSISTLGFSDGTTIPLTPDDIVVLVGPNNVGKSAALREIVMCIDAEHGVSPECKVVKKIECNVSNEENELKELLGKLERSRSGRGELSRMGVTSNPEVIYRQAANADWIRRALRAFCVYHVITENRLSVTRPTPSIDLLSQDKSHPLHYLYDDAGLEERISTVFRKAFNSDLLVNRLAGSSVHLHVGEKPKNLQAFSWSPEDRATINKMPLLHEQGDGMRAFVGCLMWTLVVDYPLLLIDEPEAFLHPPQARELGRTLAKNKKDGRQLVLATHSGDFLRGLLDGNPKSLRILRITRTEDVNNVRELQPSEVQSLWSDPLLRHSNALDGLFHSSVVLCEGDGDCQFYSAVLHDIAEQENRHKPDALFFNCAGKHRMPKVLEPLVAVGVPGLAIADFDVLRDEKPLRQIFETAGGVWEEIQKDWKAVSTSISQLKAQLDTKEFKEAVEQKLAAVAGAVVPEATLEEIRELARKASPWSHAKNAGESLIPSGEPSIAYKKLKLALRKKGIYVVPVGELERFCKTVPNHGPAWVVEVMKRNLATDLELEEARSFVRDIFWPTV